MSIKHGGTNNLEKRVGIGTISPASTLEVIGDINLKVVKYQLIQLLLVVL